jgi:regulatory protein
MRKHPSKQKPLGETELHSYALHSLAARAASIGEMRTKLERRAIRKSDVDVVIKRLRDAGYLNDARFAESFAGWRKDNQKLGRRRVERDLRARRVAPAMAQEAVAHVFEDVDENAMIREHIAKRTRRSGVPKDRKGIASLFRHLVTAGFSPSAIFPELRKMSREDAQAIEEAAVDMPE